MARVLRRDTVSTKPAFSFQDLEGQGRSITERARAEARKIVADAEQQAGRRGAQIEAEARRSGFEAGRQDGFEQGRREAADTALREARDELDQLGKALSAALNAVEQDKRRLLATAERGLIELALAIARRVCKHGVGKSSASACANARTLLEMVKHQRDLELHLNPAECAALHDKMSELSTSAGQLAHVEIVADPMVERGGCALHTSDGTVDASLENQLQSVARAILGDADADSESNRERSKGGVSDLL